MSEPPKKATRGRKRASEAVEESSSMSILPKKATRGKKRADDSIDDSSSMSVLPKKATRGKKRGSEAIDDSSSMSLLPKKATRGKKRASEAIEDASSMSILPKRTTRGKKRTSDAMEDATHMSESVQDNSKRMRFSSISDFPDDLPGGTPKQMPAEPESQPFTLASFPDHLVSGTPKRMPAEQDNEPFTMSSLPPGLLVGTPKMTPSRSRDDQDAAWQPIDVENFLNSPQEVRGFFNDILIDAGLDEIPMTGSTPEEVQAAVLAALTDAEKEMTVEQWVMYNAQRGEEKLRQACEQQILAFEAEGKRALAVLEAIPTY
jgi:hypothetical protein